MRRPEGAFRFLSVCEQHEIVKLTVYSCVRVTTACHALKLSNDNAASFDVVLYRSGQRDHKQVVVGPHQTVTIPWALPKGTLSISRRGHDNGFDIQGQPAEDGDAQDVEFPTC